VLCATECLNEAARIDGFDALSLSAVVQMGLK